MPTNILEIDIRGQICPSTLLTALREVNRHRDELRSGQLCLHLKTDSRDATNNIPGAVENMGYQVDIQKQPDCYLITISQN